MAESTPSYEVQQYQNLLTTWQAAYTKHEQLFGEWEKSVGVDNEKASGLAKLIAQCRTEEDSLSDLIVPHVTTISSDPAACEEFAKLHGYSPEKGDITMFVNKILVEAAVVLRGKCNELDAREIAVLGDKKLMCPKDIMPVTYMPAAQKINAEEKAATDPYIR